MPRRREPSAKQVFEQVIQEMMKRVVPDPSFPGDPALAELKRRHHLEDIVWEMKRRGIQPTFIPVRGPLLPLPNLTQDEARELRRRWYAAQAT